jgi:polysaccharide biosynthesis/export protein
MNRLPIRPDADTARRDSGVWALRGAIALALLFALVMVATGARAAEHAYRLQRGDVVEMLIGAEAGAEHLSSVGLDGSVAFPLVGRVPAEGVTIGELEEEIRALVSTRSLQARATVTDAPFGVVPPDEVAVRIAEYRPIYVLGHVSEPGERTFRPGLTAHQAVALAGGLRLMNFDANSIVLNEVIDLRNELRMLDVASARLEIARARLASSLRNEEFTMPAIETTQIREEELNEMFRREADALEVERTTFEEELAHLRTSLTLAEEQIAALASQREILDRSVAEQAEEVDRVRALLERGLVQSTRVTEEQRTLLLQEDRRHQARAQEVQVRREREELTREIQRIAERRRTNLLDTLRVVENDIADNRLRQDRARERLATGALYISDDADPESSGVSIAVSSPARGGERAMLDLAQATGYQLYPGDVVEIRLSLDRVR